MRTYPTPERTAWTNMKGRCYCTTRPDYKYYGGRGIEVYPEWRTSFDAWFAYVGPRPSPNHSLDRYPNQNGNYEPGNVRWATRTEQMRNARGNRFVTINGVTKIIAEWAEESGVDLGTISMRLRRGEAETDLLLRPVFPIVKRSSAVKGEQNHYAKLKESDINPICDLARSGMSQADIAERFGVTQGAIFKIVHGLNWVHVERTNPQEN